MYIEFQNIFINIQLSIFMSKKEQILELLKQEPLTSKEISTKLGFEEQETRIYLLRLKKANKIYSLEKRGRFNVYSIVEKIGSKDKAIIQDLKYDLANLYNFMRFKMKPTIEFSPEDIHFLEKIKDKIEQKNIVNQVKKSDKE